MADARKNPLSSNQPVREDSAPQGNRAGNKEGSEHEDSDDASDNEMGRVLEKRSLHLLISNGSGS